MGQADLVSNLSLTDCSLSSIDVDGLDDSDSGNNNLNDDSTLSLAQSQDPVELLCFAPELHLLPQLQRANDIIRLHRVKVSAPNQSQPPRLY